MKNNFKKMFTRTKKAAVTRGKPNDSVYVSNVPHTLGTAMFLIDPQNDFMDDPKATLPVGGAVEDSRRTASFMMKNLKNIDEIYVSLDSHARFHIAHADFWWKKEQKKPEAGAALEPWEDVKPVEVEIFAEIPHEAVLENGMVQGDVVVKFEPKSEDKSIREWCIKYTAQLEKQSNLKLMIWPYHCLIGSQGHNIQKDLWAAIEQWELLKNKPAHMIMKGKNSKTEHYSAFKAEVVVEEDPGTDFNMELYDSLKQHDRIFVAGQARSHCVNHTVRDLVGQLSKESKSTQKVILLEGGMSDVEVAKAVGEKFWADMVQEEVTSSFNISDITVPENAWAGLSAEATSAGVAEIDDKFKIQPLEK